MERLYKSLEQASLSPIGDRRLSTKKELRKSFIKRSKNPSINEKLHKIRMLNSTLKVRLQTEPRKSLRERNCLAETRNKPNSNYRCTLSCGEFVRFLKLFSLLFRIVVHVLLLNLIWKQRQQFRRDHFCINSSPFGEFNKEHLSQLAGKPASSAECPEQGSLKKGKTERVEKVP